MTRPNPVVDQLALDLAARRAGPAQVLRHQLGLTLVEIMVVLTILGIIGTIVGVSVVGALDDAKVDTTIAQIQNLEGALTRYRIFYNRYPSTSEGLTVLINPPPHPRNGRTPSPMIDGGEVPTDAWDNPFIYRSPGSGNAEYEIISLGKDGSEGGEGTAADISSATL